MVAMSSAMTLMVRTMRWRRESALTARMDVLDTSWSRIRGSRFEYPVAAFVDVVGEERKQRRVVRLAFLFPLGRCLWFDAFVAPLKVVACPSFQFVGDK